MKNKKYIIIAGVVVVIGIIIAIVYILSGRNSQVPAYSPRISTYDFPASTKTQDIEDITVDGVQRKVISRSLIVRFGDEVSSEEEKSIINKLNVAESFNIAQHIWEIRFADVVDLEVKINELESVSEILRVEYNNVYELQHTPNDYIPQIDTHKPWWLENINAQTAWDITTGDSQVIVAVFDEPADFVAEDLKGKGSQVVKAATATTPIGTVLAGLDHGSHVSGIIGANTNNGIGVAAVGYNTTILSIPVCTPHCADTLMIAGYQEVLDRISAGDNIRVINQSYIGPENSIVHDMIISVVAKGVVPVAGAGNDYGKVDSNNVSLSYVKGYPAAYPEVISVASIIFEGQFSSFSQRNDPSSFAQDQKWVDVAAPGSDVISTLADGTYASWSGTSMSTPVVSGIVALCSAANPALTVLEIVSIVQNTALEKPLDGVTYGQVDAEKIVRACKDPTNYVADPVDEVCTAWNTSYILPGISGLWTHPAPSYALENRYYVLGQNNQQGKAWWANQQADGSLGAWVEASFEAWSQQGFSAVVAKNHAYILRNGHILDMKDDGAQLLKDTELAPGGNGFNGNNMVWDTAVTAIFGSKQYIYHLGGFNMASYNYTNVIHSAEVPDGGFTAGTRFNQLSQTTPTGGSPGNGSGAQSKAAYIAGSDDSYGFIFMGQSNQSTLWRIKAKDDGTLEGSWGQVKDLPSGTGNLKGDIFSYGEYLYSIRGKSFYRIKVNPADGSFMGDWETLASLPSDEVGRVPLAWTNGHPEGPSYGIINGFLYVTSDEYVYSISLTGDCETLPVPPKDPQVGNGGSGAVGESISCVIPEWVIRGPDVVVPPITCQEASIQVANPNYIPPGVVGAAEDSNASQSDATTVGGVRCEQCAQAYVFPKPEFSPKGPTGQDVGQKDGTGQYGTDRLYYYYDYDRRAIINVPPFGFGIGGPAPLAGGSQINSPYDIPCGWPSPDKDRIVTLGCNSPDGLDPAGKYCPDGMAAGSWCDTAGYLQDGRHSTYNAMDVAGDFAIRSTMDGTAYRCVDLKHKQVGSTSYGVYVVVVGTNFRTLYAHMRVEPKDSNAINPPPSGSGCRIARLGETERYQVKRGDVLGYVGTTGDSTENHLHYEIRSSSGLLCPAAYLDQTHPYCQPGAVVQQAGVVASVQNFLQSLNPFRSGDEAEVEFSGHPSE